MKVSELILVLQALDPDALVLINTIEGGYDTIGTIQPENVEACEPGNDWSGSYRDTWNRDVPPNAYILQE